MRLPNRLRPLLVLAAASALLLGVQARALAIVLIKDVSAAEAKELGITVKVGPSANDDLRVMVEFKEVGRLSSFRYADLRLEQNGKRVVSASLQARKPAVDSPPERKLLEFYIDPDQLANASVTIVSYNEPHSGTGYRLKMKDYVSREKGRESGSTYLASVSAPR
ncbi:MAG: hypothetical protein ACK47B_11100 [Armatimonadota bacterium]